jgi:hypothetical protein
VGRGQCALGKLNGHSDDTACGGNPEGLNIIYHDGNNEQKTGFIGRISKTQSIISRLKANKLKTAKRKENEEEEEKQRSNAGSKKVGMSVKPCQAGRSWK